MRSFAVLCLFFAAAFAHAGPLTLGVVLDQDESLSDAATTQRYRAFAGEVERSVGQPVRLQYYSRGFIAIKHAKDGALDMVYGPAQVIANIGKFKFEPVLKTEQTTAASFVAGPRYQGDLAAKSGARLGLPDYESLMGGLARSEINSRGLARADFTEMKFHRMAEAPLYGLKLGRYDLAVASAEEARTWASANGGRVIHTSSSVPLRALSVKTGSVSATQQQKLASTLRSGTSLRLVLATASKDDFKGIASMLNTTPTTLPGAAVIGAAEARDLVAKGVPVYDVRDDEAYKAGSVPGAIHVPYKEGSAKEVGFDPADDQFSLSRLPRDKSAPLIMYCDGTICWKSYKSAIMALNAGWKNIYWFRGGFPEWKDAGFAIANRD